MPRRPPRGPGRASVQPKLTPKTPAAAKSDPKVSNMIPATSSRGRSVLLPAALLTQPSPEGTRAVISHRCHKSGHVFRIIRQHLYLICSYPTNDETHTVCGFTSYGGPAKMRNHIRRHALRSVNALFACPTCSGRFSRRGALATHQCDKLRGQQSIDKDFDELVKSVKQHIEMTFTTQSHVDAAVRAVWVANNNLIGKESNSTPNALFPEWVARVMEGLSLREEGENHEAAVRCVGTGGKKRKRGVMEMQEEEEWLDPDVPATRAITPDVGNFAMSFDSPASLRNYAPGLEDTQQVGLIGEHQPFRPYTVTPPCNPSDPVIMHALQHGRLKYNRSTEILVTLHEPIIPPTKRTRHVSTRHFPTTTCPATPSREFTEWCRNFDHAIQTSYQSPFNQNFDAIVERAAKEEKGRYDETYSDVWHRYDQMDVQQYERECWDLYHPNSKPDPHKVARSQASVTTAGQELVAGVVRGDEMDIVVREEEEQGIRRWRALRGYASPRW